ncbi:unnamed protein product [Linum tenue]|uniref:DUF7054 domain-containing protein n=1 Tax=Linum tenue TaxID=586396 RepID=A0AAV0JWX0_9ROSI|nr:unnamed protein product [Linum tenue]
MSSSGGGGGGGQRLNKLLVNVKIERSLGPVQVFMSPESRVKDLIKAAVEIYVREKRRPFLEENDPRRFRLHYSQFTFQSLEEEEKLVNLESRNFFMCSRPSPTTTSSSSAGCSSEDSETTVAFKTPFLSINWIDFLL